LSHLRFGHTAITWVPYFEPDEAVRDIAALGFGALETFGKVLEDYERDRGGFGRLLEEHGIRLNAAYLFSTLLDPATAADDVELNLRWARMAKDLGADAVVIGAGSRDQDSYTPDEFRVLAGTLGEIGRGCLELGLPACFHPHTGTPVETRAEIDMLMELVDPDVVFFAPDTGQIAKGGSDPVEVLRTYLAQVRHVHLKDYIGGEVQHDGDGQEIDRSGWLDYTPLGDGVVDIPTILRTLEDAGFDGWVNIELDGNEQDPRPAKEAAARSKQYLEQVLGEPIGTDKEHQHAARVD
jgi:inosose dehydratase